MPLGDSESFLLGSGVMLGVFAIVFSVCWCKKKMQKTRKSIQYSYTANDLDSDFI